jgi:hypothetical protein
VSFVISKIYDEHVRIHAGLLLKTFPARYYPEARGPDAKL